MMGMAKRGTTTRSAPVTLLKPFLESDFGRLIRWIDSPAGLIQWAGPSQFVFPLTDDQLSAYVHETPGERPVRQVYTAVHQNGQAYGHIELGTINRTNLTASICRVFIDPAERGKGLSVPMVRAVLRIGFVELGLRRIDLRVYGFNTAAIRCYEKAGFVQEGVLRKSQKVGDQFWDTVLMAILAEEWTPG
jgi:RimJ/RimL family protein N-acetyltransferase